MLELFVKKEVAEYRLSICNGCEEYNKPLLTMCSQCACFMPLKTKLANVSCPLKKWEASKDIDHAANAVVDNPNCCPGNDTPIVVIAPPNEIQNSK